jgi:outer membrane receptor protein involved in Fe transport
MALTSALADVGPGDMQVLARALTFLEKPPGWELDGYLYYQSHANGLTPADAGGTVLTPIPAYISLDARIGYKINRWPTLALSGQNLATNSQRQTSGPAVQRRVLGTMTIGF